MVRVISTSHIVGDYHGEDGADGWTYLPEKEPSPKKEKRQPSTPVNVLKPQALEGGTNMLKGNQ